MIIYSPIRSRRLATQKLEAMDRIVTFKLREENFALSLKSIQKVTTLNSIYGGLGNTGVSLFTYEGQELTVIDVGQHIFGKVPQILASRHYGKDLLGALQGEFENPASEAAKYLLILEPVLDCLIGLPIDSPPIIQSIPLSAVHTLPETYRRGTNIQCVSSLFFNQEDRVAIFLLDIDFLNKMLQQATDTET